MSNEELSWWRAYNLIDPIGRWRDDILAAQIVSTIMNVNRGPKATKVFSAFDVVMEFDQVALKEQNDPDVAKKRLHENVKRVMGELAKPQDDKPRIIRVRK
jgi:hypothetical protein